MRKQKNKNIEHVRNIEEYPLKKEVVKVSTNNNNIKVKAKRPIDEYLTLSNKDLAEEIVKPKIKLLDKSEIHVSKIQVSNKKQL